MFTVEQFEVVCPLKFASKKNKKRKGQKRERKLRLPADRKCIDIKQEQSAEDYKTHPRRISTPDCFFFFFFFQWRSKENKNNKRNKRNKPTETQNYRQSRSFSGYSERRKFWIFSFFTFSIQSRRNLWNVVFDFFSTITNEMFSQKHRNNRVPSRPLFSDARRSRFISSDLNSPIFFWSPQTNRIYYYVMFFSFRCANYIFCDDITTKFISRVSVCLYIHARMTKSKMCRP